MFGQGIRTVIYINLVGWLLSLGALIFSLVYLLRFLRDHLLPLVLPSGRPAAPEVAPSREASAPTYTLTGEAISDSSEEQPMPAVSTIGGDGASLLVTSFMGIVVALAVELGITLLVSLIGLASR